MISAVSRYYDCENINYLRGFGFSTLFSALPSGFILPPSLLAILLASFSSIFIFAGQRTHKRCRRAGRACKWLEGRVHMPRAGRYL